MGFFREVEGEAAVIVSNGIYRQCPLYTRDGHIYVKHAGGFVRLMADGSTTIAKMRLEYMSWGNEALCSDPLGRLCTAEVPRAKALPEDKQVRLLGAEHKPEAKPDIAQLPRFLQSVVGANEGHTT